MFTYEGERALGRDAIIERLRGIAQMHSGFKIAHQVKQVDCQALGVDGSALVHVQGQLAVGGVAGPGAASGSFTEVFILSQISPGEYYVASQIYRMIK